MKHSNLFPAFFILLLLTMLFACEPVAKIQVMQPAAVELPDHVQSIVIVDRSVPENNLGQVLVDALLSGRDLAMENPGRQQAVSGLRNTLANIPRFKVRSSSIKIQTSVERSFPPPLSWITVDSICKAYTGDAIAALEYYFVAARTRKSQREVTSDDKDKKEVKTIEYTMEKTAKVTFGWKLYDSKTRTILDEYRDEKSESWSKTVQTEVESMFALSGSNVNQISYNAGAAYGDRFTSLWVTVSRKYYGSGSGLMSAAKAKSKAGDWDGAVDIWKEILRKSDKELAGKAAYNMAVACEVKGELDWAKEWAEKSWSQFGNQQARGYVSAIDNRIADRKRLNEQMKEKEK
jgi:hypothetical protein